VVTESTTYVDFDIPQRDEFHKIYYTPRLEKPSFITTPNIRSPSWRYNRVRLCIPLYLRLPEDGDLSRKYEYVGGFVFVDNVQFCAFYVHMLVYINDYKSTGIDFAFLNLVNTWTVLHFFSHDTTKTKYSVCVKTGTCLAGFALSVLQYSTITVAHSTKCFK